MSRFGKIAEKDVAAAVAVEGGVVMIRGRNLMSACSQGVDIWKELAGVESCEREKEYLISDPLWVNLEVFADGC